MTDFFQQARGTNGGVDRWPLLAELYAVQDRPLFIRRLLTTFQYLLPSDYVSYNEIRQDRPASFFAVHEPSRPAATALLPLFARHAAEHPVLLSWKRSPATGHALRWSDVTSRSRLQKLALYNEYFRPLRIAYQLSVPLSLDRGHIVCLACNRSTMDFTHDERRVAELLRAHATRAYRNLVAIAGLRESLASHERVDASLGRGAVRLDNRRSPAWLSRKAASLLSTYCRWEPDRGRLPGPIAQWLRGPSPPALHPLTLPGAKGTLIVRLITDGSERFLLLNEHPHAKDPAALRALGLTRREAEILAWIERGRSNAQVATQLEIKERTVAKHLEHVFQILGVHNRTAAAAKAHKLLHDHL